MHGLCTSVDKSEMYFGGVDEKVESHILETTRISQGSFPVRYLGLPFSSKRLTHNMCPFFIDKIKQRISCWSMRKLCDGGQNVLIMVVLFGLATFGLQFSFCPSIQCI